MVGKRFKGANVIITGRNEGALKEASSHDKKISYVVADVGRTEDVERTFLELKKRHGQLRILVNNAGVAPVAPLSNLDMSQYDSTSWSTFVGSSTPPVKRCPSSKHLRGQSSTFPRQSLCVRWQICRSTRPARQSCQP